MLAKKMMDYAKEIYKREEVQYNSKAERVRLEKIIELIGRGNKVLDIGCYDGTLGSRLIKESNNVYGIEINQEVIEIATQKGIKVITQDINSRFSFENNFFDVVVAAEVIEHILDTDFFIDEIKRVLKPGGILVLSTPNIASLGRRLFLLFGRSPYFEASLGYPPEVHSGHIRFFTKYLLFGFLKHKGFEIQEFASDVINFVSSGKIASRLLAGFFPTFGRSLIVKAKLI